MRNGRTVCSSESVNGGQDVYSCKESGASSPDHLVVMVHGILGSTTDWKFAAEQFVMALPDKVFVHCSSSNMAILTLDGVDVMGERLAEEVLELIKEKPGLRKISFIAHSVGGLVARYTIGRLYRSTRRQNTEELSTDTPEEGSKGTIAGLEPMNFITVATPHLGSRGNKQVPFLFGVTAFEKVAGHVIHLIFRRTGRHLFLRDDDEGKPPLLRRMAEDDGELLFMSALRSFKRRVAYSNVAYDHIVGWRTSCIRRNNELPKWEESLNKKYPHIVYEERCKACDGEQGESIVMEDDCQDKLEEELVTFLSRVPWEKVDVSFHTSRMKFAAHSIIQLRCASAAPPLSINSLLSSRLTAYLMPYADNQRVSKAAG
nr:putative lipase YOR059C [Ipomoea batatas]